MGPPYIKGGFLKKSHLKTLFQDCEKDAFVFINEGQGVLLAPWKGDPPPRVEGVRPAFLEKDLV